MTLVQEKYGQELKQFHEDGYVLFRGALSPQQVAAVKAGIIEAFEDKGNEVMLQGVMFERGEQFEELVDFPGIVDFVEEILGTECQLSSMNGMRTTPNNAVSRWHVDEALFFPLPDGVELDARIQMPVYLVNALYYLDDVTEEMGPTQVVPGSHRAGKLLGFTEEIGTFKGKEELSLLAKAGDCLVFNSQLWHRGAPNRSPYPRYVQQIIYRKKFIVPHLSHDNNATYRAPEEVLKRANSRRKRLLGHNEQIF